MAAVSVAVQPSGWPAGTANVQNTPPNCSWSELGVENLSLRLSWLGYVDYCLLLQRRSHFWLMPRITQTPRAEQPDTQTPNHPLNVNILTNSEPEQLVQG